jgi:hypothetical protein
MRATVRIEPSMNIEMRHLRYFVAVAEDASFTAAAQRGGGQRGTGSGTSRSSWPTEPGSANSYRGCPYGSRVWRAG